MAERAAPSGVNRLAPVHYKPHERAEPEPETGTGLCLSGGGYRAMLYHVGTLWRLNEAGYLPRLDRVSSVSGGSIAAAVLATTWSDLDFDREGVSQAFEERVVEPLRRLAGRTLDLPVALRGLLLPGSINRKLARAYRDRRILGDASLAALPDRPAFVFNATNLQSGDLWRFTKTAMGDDRVGFIEDPDVSLADAVAASSAFPPFLSPARMRLRESGYAPVPAGDDKVDLHRAPFATRPVLSDGGVYDNLGLEQVWKSCRTVLISDGQGHMRDAGRVWSFWPVQLGRILAVIDNQVRDLRKRQAIGGYETGLREGAYWGIRSDVAHYPRPTPLECPVAHTAELAALKTRLARMDEHTQDRLINWGYAACDSALRSYADPPPRDPHGFPCPGGVGPR